MGVKFLKTLSGYVSIGDAIIVGVSGGPDSCALLDLLVEFSREVKIKIVVAHINHGIRGREADLDENFVKSLAKKHGLKFEVLRVKLLGKVALEERGRNIRRQFFEKLLKKYKARWIITAHTQDDQIETIVMNFLRGSGPAGLKGMDIASRKYLKPLLGVSKRKILDYLKARKLKFCTDRTNDDTSLRRNFIRKKMLPLIFSLNPDFRKTILRNEVLFGQINKWLTAEAKKFLEEHLRRAATAKRGGAPCALFTRAEFQKLPEAVKMSVIQEAYRKAKKTHYRLPFIKVGEILNLIKKGIGKKQIQCPGGGVFLMEKGKVFFI
ncbi:tRNA lysidine(34) synthetase TilS [Candidatus Peregrinibacteria bacterium]|nr:tRNA lysidine(34) synthetase TilS [Candidatus Peregrinibacteria bacterium]